MTSLMTDSYPTQNAENRHFRDKFVHTSPKATMNDENGQKEEVCFKVPWYGEVKGSDEQF